MTHVFTSDPEAWQRPEKPPTPSLLSMKPRPGWSSGLPTHLPSPFKAVLHTAHSCRLMSNFCQERRES